MHTHLRTVRSLLLLVCLSLLTGCRVNKGVPADLECIANLKCLDGAKQMWALENKKSTKDIPTLADLAPFLNGQLYCRSGGLYTIGRVREKPECTFPGHELR